MKTFLPNTEHQTNEHLEAYGWHYTEELRQVYIGVQWLDQVILVLKRAVFTRRRPNILIMVKCLRSYFEHDQDISYEFSKGSGILLIFPHHFHKEASLLFCRTWLVHKESLMGSTTS